MRRVVSAAVFLLACPIAVAQHFHRTASPAPGDEYRHSPCCKVFAEAVPQPELQKVKWVVTGKAAALPFFSQGMTQYYGFNYEEALRNFRMAKKLDPDMAMASWGIALAAGPNINLGMDRDCHQLAKAESRSAVDKANKQPRITPVERALIDALPLRYDFTEPSKEIEAQKAYRAKLAEKWKELQGDANYGALYAESIIELHPWDLYDKNHHVTSPDTDIVVGVLETAMKADPDAVGANHYWIHVVEAGPTPGDGLRSADLLQTLVKASGHLVHMPSHIYLLGGQYDRAVTSNEHASAVDAGQYKECCSGPFQDYTANPFCPQLYYGHYLSHNYFFGSVSATFSGQSRKAVAMACDTRAHTQNFLVNEPGLQRYMTAPLMTLVVNRNWDAILNYPRPRDDCYNQPPFKPEIGCYTLRAMWHWARGMAYASRDENQGQAKAEYDAMGREMAKVVAPQPDHWGNNLALPVMKIGQALLRARYEWITDRTAGFAYLRAAVTNEDALTYDEPPQWFPPAREALGGAYLLQGSYEPAIKQFDLELKDHPASGRALYGRMRALQLDGQKREAAKARIAFCAAWQNADYSMTDKDLWPVKEASGNPVVICTRAVSDPPPSRSPSSLSCQEPPWPPPPPSGRCPKPGGLTPTDCPPAE